MKNFQENFGPLLQEKLTASHSMSQPVPERPIRIFCEDESRFGLLTVQRRRITVSGIKPVGPVQYQFENFYMYGAVEPRTGGSFFLELPQLNAANVQICLTEFGRYYHDSLNIVLLDDGSCHKAKSLVIPPNVVCLF
jgi:hypothetical protein